MPTYNVTNKDGVTLEIIGDTPPTQEQLDNIFVEHNKNKIENAPVQETLTDQIKLTEESIKQDPQWVSASKSIYKWNEGEDAPDLETDKDYAEYALNYMGMFNYNLPKMGIEAAQLDTATDQQKKDFITLMDMYDQKSSSWAGAGRLLKGLATDPTTYIGLGTFGAGTAGSQAVKQAIKEGVKQGTKAGLKQGAKIGSIEGAVYSAADNYGRQSARINAGAQEEFSLQESAKAAGVGAVAGGVLGGAVGGVTGGVQAKINKNKLDIVLDKEQKSIETPTTTQKETAQEAQKFAETELKQPQEILEVPSANTKPTLTKELEQIAEPLPDVNLQPYQPAKGLLGETYQKIATKAIDNIKKPFIRFSPLKTLPEQKEYLLLRGLTGGKLTKVRDTTRKVFDTFAELTPDENFLVRKYLTKEAPINVIQDKELQNKAKELRRGVDYVGDLLVRANILDKDTVATNKGSYLPRVYLKYLDKKSNMGYTMARKDLSDETVEFLGEVTDISQRGARAIEDPMTDLVQYQMFEKVFNNPKWTLQSGLVEFQGKKVSPLFLKEERDRIADEITGNLRPNKDKKIVQEMDDLINQAQANVRKEDLSLYKKMPEGKQYGALKGAYVRKEIYDDLLYAGNVSDNWFRKIFGEPGKLSKFTKWFKFSKVALNPPSQIRNAMSNVIMLDLSGVPAYKLPTRLAQAVKDMSNNGPYTQIAKKYGIVDSTFAKQEMVDLNKLYRKLKAKKDKDILEYTKTAAALIGDYAGEAYQKIEIIGKVAKVIDEMKRGVDEANAALEAQKTLFDYSLVPASVKDMRTHSLGIPFITYYYKVLPNLLESAIRYPEKYAKYMAIPTAFAAYIASTKDVSIEDVNQLKKSMPEWIRDQNSAFILPYKDENGRWQVFDFSYFLPWSMFTGIATDAKEGELSEALRQTGALGGPIPQLITAWTTNIDPFTGREISDDRDPPETQLADKLNYLYRVAAPTWTTDIGFAGKLREAINKDVNKYGDPKITKTQAMLRLGGVNIYPIDPQKSRKSNMEYMLNEIRSIKARRTQVLKDKNLDSKERENLKNKYNEIIKDRANQLRDYKEESKIPVGLE